MEESATHFVDSLNFECILAVYEWAKGKVSNSIVLKVFFCETYSSF